MGTRGFYVFRFRGKYYVYYNHWDSYPQGLGTWIVRDIPTDLSEYDSSSDNEVPPALLLLTFYVLP